MSKKKHGLRQDSNKLLINSARNSNGAKSAVCGDNAVKFSVFAFLDEFSAVGGACGYKVGDVAEGFPCFAGTVCNVRIDSVVYKVWLVYWIISPRRRTLGRAILLSAGGSVKGYLQGICATLSIAIFAEPQDDTTSMNKACIK